jgi:hypothetical protein
MYLLRVTAYVTDSKIYTTVKRNVHMQFTLANQSPPLHLFYLQILYNGHSCNCTQHITYGKNMIKLFSIREEGWHVSWTCTRLNQSYCSVEAMLLNKSKWKSINSDLQCTTLNYTHIPQILVTCTFSGNLLPLSTVVWHSLYSWDTQIKYQPHYQPY